MINSPVFPSGNVARYLNEQLLQENVVVTAPEEAQQLLTTALRTINSVTQKVGIDLYPTALGITLPQTHILGETYYTSAALRYGDYMAKLSVAPLSANLQPFVGKPIETDNPSVLRDLVVEFFRQQPAHYELRAQLCTNLETMPIEDASIRWSEQESPYRAIANSPSRCRRHIAQPVRCMWMKCCRSMRGIVLLSISHSARFNESGGKSTRHPASTAIR
ncbi:MAG: hypothetical protein HC881_17275 [Leptolyngbyaceae cyanobacterium SL_7_1]|nr:hypothetical protein [Leptolyngbyaceae cyanobacterium SL_7_1]